RSHPPHDLSQRDPHGAVLCRAAIRPARPTPARAGRRTTDHRTRHRSDLTDARPNSVRDDAETWLRTDRRPIGSAPPRISGAALLLGRLVAANCLVVRVTRTPPLWGSSLRVLPVLGRTDLRGC